MFGDKTLPKKVRINNSRKERINVSHYITKEQFYMLRKEGKSLSEIVKMSEFPSSERTLHKYIKELGWEIGEKVYGNNLRYTVEVDFFKTWTRDSAWVYGWLLTDGSVQEKTGHIALGLHGKDVDVLRKIKNVMGFNGKVYESVRRGKRTATLRICRKEMTEDLFALGMAREDKTFNTSMPNIPDKYYWDFIRGVFEGDGSIRHYTGNTDALDITIAGATKQFMLDLQSSLESRGIFMRMDTRKANSGAGNIAEMYTLNTRSNADALRMCYFMYANTTKDRRLDRKFNVYQNYVVTYYDKVRRRSVPCIELVELARQTIPECSDAIGKRTESVKEAV